MIRTIRKLILYMGVALTAVSCTFDILEDGPEAGQAISTVRFTLSVPGVAIPTPSSRSLTVAQENAVTSVDVLVFYTGGDYSGKLFRREKATYVSGNTFEVKLPEGTYDLVVLGNASSIIDGTSGLIPQTVTKTAAVALLIHANAGGYWTATTIPMWGYKDDVEVNETTVLTGNNAIDMHRMVAKVDVQISQTAAGVNNENFALTSVRLYNYNTKGRLAPDFGNWNPTGGVVNPGKGIATAPTIPSDRGAVTGVNNPLVFGAAQGVTANNLLNTIYTFEAAKGTALALENNPCLVVGGKYKGGQETFYRMDFVQKSGDNVMYLNLLRNHRYIFSVNSVSGKGCETPEEAFNSRSFNIEVKVLQWEEGGMTGIVFDGQYYLGVSQDSFKLSRDARGASDTDNKLRIRTDVPAGWTAKAWGNLAGTVAVPNDGTTGNPWLRISPVSGNGANTPANEMTLTMDMNGSGVVRTAYIHVKAGRLTYIVKVVQDHVIPLFVRITDLSGKPITHLDFDPDNGTANTNPPPQSFRVTWSPSNRPLKISRTQTGVEPFSWQDASFALTELPAGGSYVFGNVNPVFIPSTKPFLTRTSAYLFTVSDATEQNTASAGINLSQKKRFTSVTSTLAVTGTSDYNYSGGVRTYTVTSSATGILSGGGTVSSPVTWIAEFSTDGGSTWTSSKPDWLTAFETSGPGGAMQYNAEVAAFAATVAGTEDAALKSATPKGTTSAPYDLSTKGGTTSVNTANCYVVNAAGYYKLPLVYGNAVKNGSVNTSAYNPNPAGSDVLKTFVRHDGANITGPYIYQQLTPANAVVVWMDLQGLISNVRLVDSNQSLAFDVPQGTIGQGNAIVAVRNANGTILWSWHIWITPTTIFNVANPATDATVNYTGVTYNLLKYNLGFCTARTVNFGTAPRTVQVRINQTGIENPKSQIFTIKQNNGSVATGSNNPYWQWGRKDPMPPAAGTTPAAEKPIYGNYSYATNEGAVTLSNMIQNPHVFYSGTLTTPYLNLWSGSNTVTTENDNPVIKTVYDPSPVGFKMPAPNVWTGSTSTGSNTSDLSKFNVSGSFNAGWNIYLNPSKTSTAFYPASGTRDCYGPNYGAVFNYAYSSGYFSAGPSYSNFSYNLTIGPMSMLPLANSSRAFGFSIRCVAE